jgi:uncharacterized lipoprotein YmbA
MKPLMIALALLLAGCQYGQRITELETYELPADIDTFTVGNHEVILSFAETVQNRRLFEIDLNPVAETLLPAKVELTSIPIILGENDTLWSGEIQRVQQAQREIEQGLGGSMTLELSEESISQLKGEEAPITAKAEISSDAPN